MCTIKIQCCQYIPNLCGVIFKGLEGKIFKGFSKGEILPKIFFKLDSIENYSGATRFYSSAAKGKKIKKTRKKRHKKKTESLGLHDKMITKKYITVSIFQDIIESLGIYPPDSLLPIAFSVADFRIVSAVILLFPSVPTATIAHLCFLP